VIKTLGEDGTEQFTVETRVDGRTLEAQPIHDPFIRNTTHVGLSRWDHFCQVFRPRLIRVEVTVRGTEGAQRAIMTLNPEQLQSDTEDILEQRRISRERPDAARTNTVWSDVESRDVK
jgi:hypothetical protein